ncbi:flagellar hook-length control protein FliK [Oceanicaulis sp. MMSF_3324]|uniref:flagellar hook-length control protein FliK n=1 Tax=Oceanicaulis sp. MMSF_3324 TaxID=3046702 RepID=UPI00273D3188|nr:flagellar hook-length control protein FliK [Oceanicaulis sp. MMSF_3324]
MPLDRLPPAPAPTAPSPKRAPRASSEGAQAFNLPEAENRKSASPSRSEASKSDAAKSSQSPSREGSDAKAREGAADAQAQQAQAAEAAAQDGREAALTINDLFSQALKGDSSASPDATSGSSSQAAPAVGDASADAAGSKAGANGKAAEAAAKAGAEAQPAQGDSKAGADGAKADANGAPKDAASTTGKPTEAQAATAAPASASSADQSDIAPEETVAVKPAANAKSETTAQGKSTETVNQGATAQRPVTDAQSGAADDDAAQDVEVSATRTRANAEAPDTGKAQSSTTETETQSSSETGKARGEQDASAKSRSEEPKAQPAATPSASREAEAQAQDAAAAKPRPQAETQGQTQSASVAADEAQAAAAAQAAFKDGMRADRRPDSDRAPGIQNKIRNADKSEAGSRPAAPQGGPEASAPKSANVETGAAPSANRSVQPPFATLAASAPVDPLSWLLQDSLMTGEAPVEAPSDTSDAELDMSTVRAEPRLEAARPSQHPQAHAASRFAPTTTQTLAAQIARKFNDGGRVFDIRLDPPELGRVEVRLELGPDNKVSAVLSAERADTLSELQRSARDLEKALTDAGLELGEDGLSFSLSEDNGAFDGFQQESDGSADGFSARNQFTLEVETDLPGAPLTDALYGFAVSQRAGVNLIA